MIGIPYFPNVVVNGQYRRQCPQCGALVPVTKSAPWRHWRKAGHIEPDQKVGQ